MSEEQIEAVEEIVEEIVEERNFEEEAKVLGWHNPKDDDFKGDVENALGAEEFVKRGEEILPIVNANNKKLMAEIKKNNEQHAKDREEYKAHMEATSKRERADYDRQLKEAESDEDFVRYKALKDNAPAEPVAQSTGKKSAIEIDFEARHDWYGVDEKRTNLAIAAENSIKALRGVLSKEEYLDRVDQEMERLMPTKQTHNTVTSSRKKIGGAKTAESFEAMPKEYQDACQAMEKNQWGVKREDYVKNYFAGHK